MLTATSDAHRPFSGERAHEHDRGSVGLLPPDISNVDGPPSDYSGGAVDVCTGIERI